jgi:hypothetical protein
MGSKTLNYMRFNQRGGAYHTLYYILALVSLFVVVVTAYFFSYGYRFSPGMNSRFYVFDKRQQRTQEEDVTRDPETVPEPVPPLPPPPPQITPPPQMPPPPPQANIDLNLPFSPEERPSGMPGAQSKEGPSVLEKLFKPSQKKRNAKKDGSVFNVSRNIYKYDDAAPLCKAMGAELATYDQVIDAYKHGADWCNYGWIKGQMAVYPTQDKTWEKLQEGPPESRFSCGRPGVNGGFFDNPGLTFGVNCFGKRPMQSDSDDLLNKSEFTLPPTTQQIEFDKQVQKFREGLENVTVLPFNRNKWAE